MGTRRIPCRNFFGERLALAPPETAQKIMKTPQDPEAADTAPTKEIPAVAQERLVRGGSESSLDALAVRDITCLSRCQRSADKYNDYGSVMAIRDEVEEIESDIRAALYSATRRSRRLSRRIELWESENREVDLLSIPANAKTLP
jgi:hypothetical protein